MTPLQRVRSVLLAEADAIAAVPVTDAYERAARVIAGTRDLVVTTGMGKAGHIAKKFAATLCSTGTPSAFVHPGESAHGDLGLLSAAAVLVALSTSGKTTEVLEMLAACRRLAPSLVTIGITSHQDAPLRSRCDLILDMGLIEEPCPLGLTPSASSTVMLAVTDAVALAVMELRGVQARDFGVRHRAGYLGALTLREASSQ